MCTVLPLFQWALAMNKSLEETDPDLFDIMEHEKVRPGR